MSDKVVQQIVEKLYGKPEPVERYEYRHLVDAESGNRGRLYDGPDAADAMAAWSKAVSDGVEYVTLESLRVPVQETP